MKNVMKRILVLALAFMLVFALSACGGKDKDSGDDPNLGVWVATTGEMLGISIEVGEFFGSGFTIELDTGGKCVITADGKKANGKWTLNDTEFTVKGGGFDSEGTLEGDKLTLENIMGMGLDLIFYKEDNSAPQ